VNIIVHDAVAIPVSYLVWDIYCIYWTRNLDTGPIICTSEMSSRWEVPDVLLA